jgi:hypothetical protein
MTHDRHLIDTIKMHFARKSSAELQEIAQTNNLERWSAEAVAAADEVLKDRGAGRAKEPAVAEEERRPPRPMPDASSLAFLALGLFGGLSGHLHFHVHRVNYAGDPDPDLPVPFGPKMAWLALDTSNTDEVARALGLVESRLASWAEGIDGANQSLVFVTPPLADWTLAVGGVLFPPDQAQPFVKPLLERLSRQFGDAQYFCTHADFGLHLWARARQGQLVRGYGWLGHKRLTLWNEGAPTKEERDLGFQFFDGQSHTAEQLQNKSIAAPDEAGLMQLACMWSIDPTSLDEQVKEPSMGLLGQVPWSIQVLVPKGP